MYLARQRDNDLLGIDSSSSSAGQLISVLKALSEQKEIRYVALFHEVKETTLLAISKATQKAEQKRLQQMSQQMEEATQTEVDGPGGDLGSHSVLLSILHKHPISMQVGF